MKHGAWESRRQGGDFPEYRGKEFMMKSIELARRMAELGDAESACKAYSLAIHENDGADPAQDMEAAIYILQEGGRYKTAYTCFVDLYNRGCFQEDCLGIITEAFYAPNRREIQNRYERNCKLLGKYPYLFRKDFPEFDTLPIRFFPFDDTSYVPFYVRENRFGEHYKPKRQVISRNFFKDLDKPILASEVFSQYELEYLHDNVRKSEYIGRENHVYLHYPSWEVFCSYLSCLNMRPLLEGEKLVFLFGDELGQYPIDFKERFGLDYGQYHVKSLGIREFTRLIWHTQLSSHNGGDFFNEIFDSHPNLLAAPSIMFDGIEEAIASVRTVLNSAPNAQTAVKIMAGWDRQHVEELYLLRDRTDKDILVAIFLHEQCLPQSPDPASRITPAIFFQPHFSNLFYTMTYSPGNRVKMYSEQYEKIRTSPLFRGFKYIKTFTPMRRITTSHGATVRYVHKSTMEKQESGPPLVVFDVISQRVLNRSFMIDWQDRLYMDSVLVRFEDGKLNPKATFTALAAFLDLPYTESMTYCSEKGEIDPTLVVNGIEKATGFDTSTIYRTYDDYTNDEERYFLEYFMRDAYEYYGYDFKYYDGTPVDEDRLKVLLKHFTTMDYYIEESWRRNVFSSMTIKKDGKDIPTEQREQTIAQMVDKQLRETRENRLKIAILLLNSPYFINENGQPLHMMPKLELDPALLEQPL